MDGERRPVVVIGVGNALFSDEGVGIHIIEALKRMELPPYVDVVDCDTNGLAVLESLDGAQKGIIIDAVSSGGLPGTVYRLTVEGLLGMEDRLLKLVSLHQLDLIATLKLAQLTDVYRLPEDIVIIGIEAKSFATGLELTEEVRKAIPKVIDLILKEIEAYGQG